MLHSYVIGTLGKCKPAKEPKGKPVHNLVQSNKMLYLEIDKVLLAQPTHKCLAVLDASRKQMRSCQHLFAHSHLSLLCFRSGCYLRPSMIRTEIQRGPTTWVSVCRCVCDGRMTAGFLFEATLTEKPSSQWLGSLKTVVQNINASQSSVRDDWALYRAVGIVNAGKSFLAIAKKLIDAVGWIEAFQLKVVLALAIPGDHVIDVQCITSLYTLLCSLDWSHSPSNDHLSVVAFLLVLPATTCYNDPPGSLAFLHDLPRNHPLKAFVGPCKVASCKNIASGASIKTLSELDATFVDLRVACMEPSIVEILKQKSADENDLIPKLSEALNSILQCFTDGFANSKHSRVSNLMALLNQCSKIVLLRLCQPL